LPIIDACRLFRRFIGIELVDKYQMMAQSRIDDFNLQPNLFTLFDQGLCNDLERFEDETVTALIASLKRRGVSDEIINQALSEVVNS